MQRVGGVVAQMPGAYPRTQQPVQSGGFGGYRLAHVFGQGSHRPADGFGQPRGGFAGGCGQPDAQLAALAQGRALQQGEQADDGGGLAGAGATGDDGQRAPDRQRAGDFLPVGPGRVFRRKQRLQPFRQVFGDLDGLC